MAEKFKQRLVIEVTFDRPVTETEAYHLVRQGIDTTHLNPRVRKFFVTPKPEIRNFQIKRWSRVLASIKPKE